MANRVYGYQGYKGYQFETSPRKLQPEYQPEEPKAKKTAPKQAPRKAPSSNESRATTQNQNRKMSKEELSKKLKLVCYIAFGFAVLFTISYRNSIINEKFNNKENLKAELADVQKTNEQLQVGIENELNLTNVEAIAKETLGMAKLSNSQKVYINLPRKEYVESASQGITKNQNENAYQRFLGAVKNFFNIN